MPLESRSIQWLQTVSKMYEEYSIALRSKRKQAKDLTGHDRL